MSLLRSSLLATLAVVATSCGSKSEKAATVAGGAASSASPAANAGEGFQFTLSMTTDASAGQPVAAAGIVMQTKVRVLGSDVRMDFESDANPSMRKGSFMLMGASSPKLTVVNPIERKAIVIDPAQMAGVAGAMGGGQQMKMDVADVSSRTEELGPGETILGFTTKKYRVTNGYTMNISVMGRTTSSRTESVSTMQVSEELGSMAPAFQNFGERFANAFLGFGGDAMKKIMELNRSLPRGFALAQEQVTTATAMGRTMTTTSRLRVSAFTRGGVTAAYFVVPDGLTTVDMMQEMQAKLPRRGNAVGAPPVRP
jgi:hypothetical protein